MNRCVCGYEDRYHEIGTTRCPELKKGRFRLGPPPDTSNYREIARRDARRRAAEAAEKVKPYVPVRVPPPIIPARAPECVGEVAGYRGRQALGLGRAAAAHGWKVRAFYARAHDNVELSAIQMKKGDLRAVATWHRPAGHLGKATGWKADVAYAWRQGQMPVKVSHTDLERFIQ